MVVVAHLVRRLHEFILVHHVVAGKGSKIIEWAKELAFYKFCYFFELGIVFLEKNFVKLLCVRKALTKKDEVDIAWVAG